MSWISLTVRLGGLSRPRTPPPQRPSRHHQHHVVLGMTPLAQRADEDAVLSGRGSRYSLGLGSHEGCGTLLRKYYGLAAVRWSLISLAH